MKLNLQNAWGFTQVHAFRLLYPKRQAWLDRNFISSCCSTTGVSRLVASFYNRAAFSLSAFSRGWRRLTKCAFSCCTLGRFSSPSSSCSHSCLFFRQGSRIEGTTSVTLFMRTTACWIRKLTNAGRSLLLTLSGIIGRAAAPSGAFVESRKLLCWACYLVLLCRVEIPGSHLEQQPWPRMSLPILFLNNLL